MRELGLAPAWRLRTGPLQSSSRLAPALEVEPARAKGPVPVHGNSAVGPGCAVSPFGSDPPAQVSEVTRSVRIAALSWDGFAADVEACVACGLCKGRRRSVPGVGDV